MRRREFLKSVTALTAASTISAPAIWSPAKAQSRQETLLIVSESGPNNLDIHGVGTNVPGYEVSGNCYDRLISHEMKTLPNGTPYYDKNKLRPELADDMASLVSKAHKFRRWYREEMLKLFTDIDVILAPATPCMAPLIGQQTFMFDDHELPVRANLGIYTQPISFIGLPVVAVPVPLSPLPIAVQIIAAPWREEVALRVAYALEANGIATAPRPMM